MWLALVLAAQAYPPMTSCPAELDARHKAALAARPAEETSARAQVAGRYLLDMRLRALAHWTRRFEALPQDLQARKAKYTAWYGLTFDSAGAVTMLCLQSSSGAPAVDQAVYDTIWDGSPYGALPETIRDADGTFTMPNLFMSVDAPPNPLNFRAPAPAVAP